MGNIVGMMSKLNTPEVKEFIMKRAKEVFKNAEEMALNFSSQWFLHVIADHTVNTYVVRDKVDGDNFDVEFVNVKELW